MLERATGGINVFVSIPKVSEREYLKICKFEMDIKKSFSCRSNLSN